MVWGKKRKIERKIELDRVEKVENNGNNISKNNKFFKIPELTNLTDGINETIDYLKHGIQYNLLPSSFIDV